AENLCGFKLWFNSKRLGNVGKGLAPAKHNIIRKGSFGDLLDIQPFKVSHELIEFVVMHTNHMSRQFRYKNKVINFSRLMVKRIFNVPSGDRPVKLLKKSDQCNLCNIYKRGTRSQSTMQLIC
uniref:Uncharacterized protein n=1 Tax=Aegilops tauschii subsp. strangulata TaxID=200361 RepID=A0A453EBE1_AEGTS